MLVFGSEARVRRPILLLFVFGAFVALVGITASAQASMVTSNVTDVLIKSVVDGDAVTVREFVSNVTVADLDGTTSPFRRTQLDERLKARLAADGILEIQVARTDGSLVSGVSLSPTGIGSGSDIATSLATADGRAEATIVPLAAAGAAADLGIASVLRERLPIRDVDGQVKGVVSVWRDAGPILARLDALRFEVVTVTLSAALVAAVLLFLIFRSAQSRLTRQTTQLVEATRRDQLTGTFNHGALVDQLAGRIDAARSSEAAVGVALVDVDNFTLLNDNHGHRVGDGVLLAVLEELKAAVPADAVIGRYGPDEFLVIVPAGSIQALEPAIESVRAVLIDRSLDVDLPDRLPITVSAGIASYPRDAASLTNLLAMVAATLQTAKSGGGDRISVAGSEESSDAGAASSFDVLQGLVFAVDTKDRYTKRHSEDVARYAIFLAQRLELDESTIATIRLAGLLHDVGKIGIPDQILRKPGPLTSDEYAVVKQHVVLGDMIVRDLPEIDLVRAGIRHHHERWDGQGYVDRLEGEEIPLIARILAIGDAFSAMTTTRPYRKALDIQEAIRRLEDAAGTQLDERLVTAFVTGLETAADPPLPGTDPGVRLWTPRAVA